MQPEIEVKFLDCDHGEIRKKLAAVGAQCTQPRRLMRRAIIDYPDRRLEKADESGWGWIRVRDEGDKITCTYKHVGADERRTTHEIEFAISDFDQAIKFFQTIGLEVLSTQETKRETWQLGTVQVMLDEWPWIPPYIEIEGETEAEIRNLAEALGMDWKTAVHGSSDAAYRLYFPKMSEQDGVSDISELTFAGEMPMYLKERQ